MGSTAERDTRLPRRLTPTERKILVYVATHEGRPCAKAQIAKSLKCSVKTVDRLVSRLRSEGILVCEYLWADNGAQLANSYRLAREPSNGRHA